ncbi:uncharacterized protein LOC111864609 [Cryptotermes secundus]|uniref:uncharacterized protein LOC111864609 n=1 Tax=Cryptotermes secundus TaxID=105785 RepID=UPI000CD7C96D|nr:uncharacterized protein LOC111864609 [Cryptotermes secundus]
MSKWIYCTFAILLVALGMIFIQYPAFADTTVGRTSVYRKRRFLFGWGFAGSHCGGPGDCPPHHCSRDEAVILGYCCGCGRYSDRVPISCPGHLQCPLSPEPLCSDYNYMMDCCC